MRASLTLGSHTYRIEAFGRFAVGCWVFCTAMGLFLEGLAGCARNRSFELPAHSTTAADTVWCLAWLLAVVFISMPRIRDAA